MSSTPLALRELAAGEDWDDLVSRSPRATVFHRRAWLDVIAGVSAADLRLYRIERDGEAIGAAPLFLFRRGPFRIAAAPPPQAAAPYLGPLVDDALDVEALGAMSAEARRLGAAYFEARLDHEIAGGAAPGFECESRSTYVLDLRPGAEALWNDSINSACRRAVRKAQSSKVSIEEVELSSFLSRYYEMAASVFAKWNREPPLSRADYERMARVQKEGGCVKVFAARLDGEIVAAGVFPYGDGAVYYLDGVSDPAGQGARPNNLLHWEVIQWACREGLERYDMVGAGISGVARFKETFGPALVPYTYAFRTLSPVAGVARAAYARLAPAARALQYSLGKLLRRGEPS
jgi:CelD/BcsL family acetyltransferase involved in cellulose biosynthesis